MESIKPSILSGMMELLPPQQRQFDHIKSVIQKHFHAAGCIQIDTPILEKSEVLLAKGGGETEKQIYRFMKGDTDISMRFDLTVPLARYVAMHFPDLVFPFRVCHIGKVYRGERNQFGRYREFYQCDIDIIGNQTLDIAYDAQVPSVIIGIFEELDFAPFTIRFNNRKVLNGLFTHLGIAEPALALRAVDKLEKIGHDALQKELSELGVTSHAIEQLLYFMAPGDSDTVLTRMHNFACDNELYRTGVFELQRVYDLLVALGKGDHIAIDPRIARGLDYYTGTVYETQLNDYPQLGSICSGGRYDNLASYYTKQTLPGVGMSIGLTRLFAQLAEASLLKDIDIPSPARAALVCLEDEAEPYALYLLRKWKEKSVMWCPGNEKLSKRIQYVDKLQIPYLILVGTTEMKARQVTIKNLKTGIQVVCDPDAISQVIG